MKDYKELYTTTSIHGTAYVVYEHKNGLLIKIVPRDFETQTELKSKALTVSRAVYDHAGKKYGFDMYYENGDDAWKLCDELCNPERGVCEHCGHPL